MKPDRKEIMVDGSDVVHIEVRVVDASGVLMPYADNNITFHISGGGRIIGVDNWDLCSNESYKSNQRRAYQGRCLAIVQAITEGGEIEFIVKSPGLELYKLLPRQRNLHITKNIETMEL